MAISERWPLKSTRSVTGINGNNLWDGFARTGTNATYRNSSGNVVTAAANAPRYEYDENGTCLGLLVENAKTENMASGPQGDLSTLYWTHSQITYSAGGGGTAPDGTSTADSFVDDNSGGSRAPRISDGISAGASQTDCYSIFAKCITPGTSSGGWMHLQADAFTSVSAIAFFDVENGTVGTLSGGAAVDSGIIPYGNGWYRVWLTWTNQADTSGGFRVGHATDGSTSYVADGKEIAFWGPQAEDSSNAQGNGPSSFAIGARAKDDITHADISGWYSSGTGVSGMLEYYKYGERPRNCATLDLFSGIGNSLGVNNSSGFDPRVLGTSTAINATSSTAHTDTHNITHRTVFSFASNDARVGCATSTAPLIKDAAVTWPPSTEFDKLDIASGSAGLSFDPGAGGIIFRDIVLYDEAQADAALVTLATNGLEYITQFPGTVAGDGGVMWPPRANDPRWTQLLTDSGITQSGNFMDDVKKALLALSGATSGSLDDLWKKTLAANAVTDISEPYLY